MLDIKSLKSLTELPFVRSVFLILTIVYCVLPGIAYYGLTHSEQLLGYGNYWFLTIVGSINILAFLSLYGAYFIIFLIDLAYSSEVSDNSTNVKILFEKSLAYTLLNISIALIWITLSMLCNYWKHGSQSFGEDFFVSRFAYVCFLILAFHIIFVVCRVFCNVRKKYVELKKKPHN